MSKNTIDEDNDSPEALEAVVLEGRQQLDELDATFIADFAALFVPYHEQRAAIVGSIGIAKAALGLEVYQAERHQQVYDGMLQRAQELGVPEEAANAIAAAILGISVSMQEDERGTEAIASENTAPVIDHTHPDYYVATV